MQEQVWCDVGRHPMALPRTPGTLLLTVPPSIPCGMRIVSGCSLVSEDGDMVVPKCPHRGKAGGQMSCVPQRCSATNPAPGKPCRDYASSQAPIA